MIHIFIQAREGSTRLPRKILLEMAGKTVFELLVERMQGLGTIVLVTGPEEENSQLIGEAKRLGLDFFCGAEENVLDRFYNAAEHFKADIIVRVLGDSPLTDPQIMRKGLELFWKEKPDVLWTQGVPYGMGFEIFKKSALKIAWEEMKKKYAEKFGYIFLNPVEYLMKDEKFEKTQLIYPENYAKFRLAIDYQEDFEVIKKVFENLYSVNPGFGVEDVISFLKAHEDLLYTNKHYGIPETYR